MVINRSSQALTKEKDSRLPLSSEELATRRISLGVL